MTQEQKLVFTRLGIVAAVLAIVVAVVYFVYSPKDLPPAGKIYPSGSHKSIAAIFRAGTWSIDSNGTGLWEGAAGDSGLNLGKAGDIPLTGTWDLADGPSIGVFSNGVFTLLINGRPQTIPFGAPGDLPVVGDWNGDGRTKVGIFRKGFWLLDLNGNGRWDGSSIDRAVALGGTPGELPIVGDWNGDGKTDIGVYRPPSVFLLDANGNGMWDKGDKIFAFGSPGDTAVLGDWNGDGRTKLGVFHNGFWSLDYNGNFAWDGSGKDRFIALGGVAGDVPIIGDWNGDGRTKVGVFRGNQWLIDTDGNGVYDKLDKPWTFGLPGDVPIVINPAPTKK